MKIQYVLPVKGGSGGAHSVAQEVNELIKFGLDARIAVNSKNAPIFFTNYVDLENIANSIDSYSKVQELASLLENKDLVVCTIFTSVRIVKDALELVKGRKPAIAYYIQDYEPLFLHADEPLRIDAIKSYTQFEGALLFAKTDWIRDVVTRNHDVPVEKVAPSLDSSIYYPKVQGSRNEFWVTAMIRPHTKRRAPRRTMNVLKDLHTIFGKKVNINIFGCSTEDLVACQFPTDFDFTNHGVLHREQVGALFRSTDLFMDLSDYQAFGRTGLEAMACGAATILPVFGGSHEYACHRQNTFLVDTRSHNEIVDAAKTLVTMDAESLTKLRNEAVYTSQNYSISKSAFSKFTLFQNYLSSTMS